MVVSRFLIFKGKRRKNAEVKECKKFRENFQPRVDRALIGRPDFPIFPVPQAPERKV
jgi:hypothetical protein